MSGVAIEGARAACRASGMRGVASAARSMHDACDVCDGGDPGPAHDATTMSVVPARRRRGSRAAYAMMSETRTIGGGAKRAANGGCAGAMRVACAASIAWQSMSCAARFALAGCRRRVASNRRGSGGRTRRDRSRPRRRRGRPDACRARAAEAACASGASRARVDHDAIRADAARALPGAAGASDATAITTGTELNPTNEAGAATAAASDDRALPAAYPFSALIGQAALQQALLLVAVDPGLGGVLVSGPRGTAKSTAARALAELLPEGRFVTLPLSASDEQVTGSLDLARALADNTVRFSPGLVARAHLGVLYVDEINLLPDALVDALLDAAASGVNTVERDGVSHSHAARFALVGTMNPEEGELRPQLLDRFGLMVELANCYDAATRQRIVKARLAFDLDPHGFRAQYRDAQAALVAQIRAARAALPALAFDDAAHARVAELCIGAAVDGLRGDLVMLRAARALAALDGAARVAAAHVERVAADVLRHRRTRFEPQPEFQPGFQPGSQAGPQPMGRREPPPASRSAGGDAPGGRADPGEAEATRAPTPRDALPGGASGPAHPAARAPSDAQRRAADERGAARDGGRGPAADDSDWGYLPPEPAGIAPVKGVIPLPLKKR